jgi:hypothetical protein
MLAEHGVFPLEVVNRSLREKLVMLALLEKDAKEKKKLRG